MTKVERQTMYLETFQKLKEQAKEQIPPKEFEIWMAGAVSMCAALAKMDDEVTDTTYRILLVFFRQTCVEV